jgi:hypothetical protein
MVAASALELTDRYQRMDKPTMGHGHYTLLSVELG